MAKNTMASQNNSTVGVPQAVISATKVQDWIVSYLAEVLDIDSEDIDVTVPFDHYGLDSAVAMGMTGDLEDWLEAKIDPTLLYDYPTIESFSQHLVKEIKIAA